MRFDAAQPHELLERDAELIAERAEMLFDQSAVEAIVSRRHRRMSRENRLLSDLSERFVERDTIFLHSLPDRLRVWRRRYALR